MHKILFVVRLLEDGVVTAGYSRDLDLPFVPTVGMQFAQGNSTTLWEVRGGELNPGVEKVIYDFDEEHFVCLFTVTKPLESSFWKGITNFHCDSFEAKYFR